jgi:hypothetical protein
MGYETGVIDGIAEYYLADVATVSDYYAFRYEEHAKAS